MKFVQYSRDPYLNVSPEAAWSSDGIIRCLRRSRCTIPPEGQEVVWAVPDVPGYNGHFTRNGEPHRFEVPDDKWVAAGWDMNGYCFCRAGEVLQVLDALHEKVTRNFPDPMPVDGEPYDVLILSSYFSSEEINIGIQRMRHLVETVNSFDDAGMDLFYNGDGTYTLYSAESKDARNQRSIVLTEQRLLAESDSLLSHPFGPWTEPGKISRDKETE